MYGIAANPHVFETGQGLSLGRARMPLSSCALPQLIKSLWQARGKSYRLIAALDPAFPNQQPELADFQWPSLSRVGRPGETEREVKASAKEKWPKHNKSALSGDTLLSLPLAYPGTEPLMQREIDAMMNCDPKLEYCKDPVYQWTAKCTRCQGTGEVSFYRKQGREVISKYIACIGIDKSSSHYSLCFLLVSSLLLAMWFHVASVSHKHVGPWRACQSLKPFHYSF